MALGQHAQAVPGLARATAAENINKFAPFTPAAAPAASGALSVPVLALARAAPLSFVFLGCAIDLASTDTSSDTESSSPRKSAFAGRLEIRDGFEIM